MKHVTLAPFPGSALAAEQNRDRVSADLTGRGFSIALWLAVSLALSLAGWSLFNQLALLDAALKCAGAV